MVLDLIMGGAFIGLFSGALVSQMTTRVANKTLDFTTEEVERVLNRFRGDQSKDPETKCVIRTLHNHELEGRTKLAKILICEYKDDPSSAVQVCVNELGVTMREIEEILRDIRIELAEHRQRWFSDLLFSDVRPMLEVLKEKLDSVDKKVSLLVKVKHLTAKLDSSSPKHTLCEARARLLKEFD